MVLYAVEVPDQFSVYIVEETPFNAAKKVCVVYNIFNGITELMVSPCVYDGNSIIKSEPISVPFKEVQEKMIKEARDIIANELLYSKEAEPGFIKV